MSGLRIAWKICFWTRRPKIEQVLNMSQTIVASCIYCVVSIGLELVPDFYELLSWIPARAGRGRRLRFWSPLVNLFLVLDAE